MSYTEKAVSFGPEQAMVGVLAEPLPAHAVVGAPPLLIWNTGVNHHVGPWRFNVEISRHLAALGFAALRFDASGIGDSDPRSDGATELERQKLDLSDAMALLQKRRGDQKFALLGFCSSTDPAHAVMLSDPRVVGAIFVEGYAYRSPAFHKEKRKRYLMRERWERTLTKKARVVLSGQKEPERGPSIFQREYPAPEKLRDDLRAVLERGVKLHFTYSGGDTDFNHLEQFDDMLGDASIRQRCDVRYWPEADHTFFRVEDRARLIEHLGRWYRESLTRP